MATPLLVTTEAIQQLGERETVEEHTKPPSRHTHLLSVAIASRRRRSHHHGFERLCKDVVDACMSLPVTNNTKQQLEG